MSFPSVFSQETTNATIERINSLTSKSEPKWGTMNVAQMLAHTNVSYDLAFLRKSNKPNPIMKFLLKLLVKPMVVNEKEYPKNSRTAPIFIIANERNFEKEKELLIDNIKLTQAKGPNYFDGRESPSLGALTSEEWNNLFYKHLDHHLKQFGV